MTRIVVVGSINMDLVTLAPRFVGPGETILGERFLTVPGGKGANQAVAAARAGATVRFTSACGRDDFGDELAAALEADGLDLTGMRRVGDSTGVAMIFVDDGGENQIAVIPGANDAVEPPAADPEVGVWLVQAEVPVAAVEGTLAAARATGATALVNASPAGRIPPALVAAYDVAIVNETELEALGDRHSPHVVLTLGSRGVRILPEDVALSAIPARVVDTTGAGDALAGTAAAVLAEGRTLEEAVGWGIAAASLSVERHGCQPAMPRRAEIEARMRRAASA